MHSQDEVDYVTGIYRCSDPINLLKIRVRLEKVKSSCIPLPESDNDGSGTLPIEEESEERVFSWQEKVFSPTDIDNYDRLTNSPTALDQEYHKKLAKVPKKLRARNRLYTTTDADEFTQSQSHQEVVVGHSKRSFLENSMCKLRSRRGAGFKKIYRSDVQLALKNLVDDFPTNDFKEECHVLTSVPQVMCILADLSVRECDDEWHSKREYILCILRYYPDGVLQISPDFSREKSLPYQIEVDSDSKIVYHYWIQHDSMLISDEEDSKEKAIVGKLTQYYQHLLRFQVGLAFEIPPERVSVIYIMGEIVTARNFELNNIFVHYGIDLPKGWTVDDPKKLSGFTQTSNSTVDDDGVDVVHFGHLFEMQLVIDHEHISVESDGAPPKWPVLVLKVTSVDCWGRHRTEGYGHSILPLHPGPHTQVIKTWRSISHSPIGLLRRYFVGSLPEVEDLSYVGVPKSHTKSLLSRYGHHTVCSGSVVLRHSVVILKNPRGMDVDSLGLTDASILNEDTSLKTRNVSASSLFKSVDSMVSAFFKARAQLKKIKDKIKNEFNHTE